MKQFQSGDPSLNTEGSPEPIDSARRTVVAMLLASRAITALSSDVEFIGKALAQTSDLTRDTLTGVAAFFVPGRDPYSVHQGESTLEPGGPEAGAGEGLFQGLNFANPFLPTLADTVAGLLNTTALALYPTVSGPFLSAFSNLSFVQKGRVFAALEGSPASAPIAGVLPVIVGFLSYAETSVFNPVARTISGRPIGWALSNYSGVSDGRNEFKGFFKNRRKALDTRFR